MLICYYAKEEFKTNMVTYGCDYYLIGRKVHYLPPMKKILVEYASVFFVRLERESVFCYVFESWACGLLLERQYDIEFECLSE